MTDTTVQLGPFAFQDFEVPEKIPFGGEQALAVSKLIGGQKVADALGWFPKDITWSGRFRGPYATNRALYVQGLFNGKSLTLTWDDFRFQVVGKTFDADYERFYEVPYTLNLEVISDLTAPVTSLPAVTVDDQVDADMSQAQTLGAAVGNPGLTSALSSLSAAVSAVTTFASAPQATLNSVLAPLSTALSVANGLISSNSAIISSVSTFGGMVAGGDAATLAATLTAQAQAMTALGNLGDLTSVLTRIQVNLQADGASGAVLVQAAGNLYSVAAQAYGDPSEWATIAQANGLVDPDLTGLNTLRIPATSDGDEGVWPT